MESNNKPFISVIMNCYNGEKYLSESVESVLAQTYQNWELIFWDNKSKDKSAAIFNSYKDKRLKYFCSNEHTSLYKGRNLAIEKSKGEFVSFLDTDDMWDTRKLELQIPYFKNPEVGLVFSNFFMVKENLKKKKLYINKKLPRGNIYNELINNYTIGILTTMIRKKLYLSSEKKFDERFSIVGDFDLFLRLSKNCICESIQEPLAFYRIHGKNLSTLDREIKEMQIWLEENKIDLNNSQIEKIKENIDYKKFLNFKTSGKFTKSLKFLLNSNISLFSLKNLFVLISPNILLKKLLWFHNDFD